jgi:hypothetical protein
MFRDAEYFSHAFYVLLTLILSDFACSYSEIQAPGLPTEYPVDHFTQQFISWTCGI